MLTEGAVACIEAKSHSNVRNSTSISRMGWGGTAVTAGAGGQRICVPGKNCTSYGSLGSISRTRYSLLVRDTGKLGDSVNEEGNLEKRRGDGGECLNSKVVLF